LCIGEIIFSEEIVDNSAIEVEVADDTRKADKKLDKIFIFEHYFEAFFERGGLVIILGVGRGDYRLRLEEN
jgi:hypothetical protein